jgi:osmotically-inducible protein OsmY
MSAHSEPKKDLTKQHTSWVKRPSAGHLTDTKLAAAAVDAIEWLTTVPQETIKVTARSGWLYLEGTVNCRSQLTTVEDVTRHVPGVQGVIDTIKIDDAATQTEATTALR